MWTKFWLFSISLYIEYLRSHIISKEMWDNEHYREGGCDLRTVIITINNVYLI